MNRTPMGRKVEVAIVTPGTASIIWWGASIFTSVAHPSHYKVLPPSSSLSLATDRKIEEIDY